MFKIFVVYKHRTSSWRSRLHVTGTWSVYKIFFLYTHEICEGARDPHSKRLVFLNTRFTKGPITREWHVIRVQDLFVSISTRFVKELIIREWHVIRVKASVLWSRYKICRLRVLKLCFQAILPLDIFTVYDRHVECPAWAAMDECKTSNWTWMMDNCPRSCEVPCK